MALKQKRGCWCPQCSATVVGHKNTRRGRRVGHGAAALLTGGATLAYTAAAEAHASGWYCTICDGPDTP